MTRVLTGVLSAALIFAVLAGGGAALSVSEPDADICAGIGAANQTVISPEFAPVDTGEFSDRDIPKVRIFPDTNRRHCWD